MVYIIANLYLGHLTKAIGVVLSTTLGRSPVNFRAVTNTYARQPQFGGPRIIITIPDPQRNSEIYSC